jgi:serine/threonine protein kinase
LKIDTKPRPPGATLQWHATPPTPSPVAILESAPVSAPSRAPRVAPTIIDAELTAEPPIRLKPQSRLEGTPYEITRWLGDGGMGVVLEARHIDLDRRVALKILRTTDAGPVVDLFRQEARALARLGSEYVVQVFDFVELRDGRLMIAMELLDGVMLSDELGPDTAPMSLDRAIPILRQVCKGLAVAHRAGIVHRDVKPANIALLRRNGRADAVKLLDFGVAQIAGHAGSRAGTPGYLAPEVATDMGGDPRSDIYAVGCLAYLMLAGRPPFVARDPGELLLAHLSDPPPPPSKFASVPAVLESIVLRCLAKNPAERFARADDLEAALCEAQIALRVQTPWDDLPLPDVDPDRRERLLRDMPELVTRKPRAWLPWALGGSGVAAAMGLAAGMFLFTPTPTDSELAEVDALTHRARAAAARAFFVYPPPEQPEEPTAFTVVRELEERNDEIGDAATERAAALRQEFADTLERLGDQYWSEEGGRPFALDYYAQVLVFDPDREVARERAAMTPGELRSLRQKAETSTFEPGELEAVEPLLVLAEIDADEKAARLQKMDEERSESSRARIDRLVGGKRKKHPARTVVAEREPVAPVESAAPIDAPSLEMPAPVVAANKPAPGDPKAAKRLTKEGDAARRRGDTHTAESRYAQALAADRRWAPAYAGLAAVQYDAGNYALAARTADKAVRLAPRNAEYRILLGDAYYKSYDRTAARNQYQRASELGHASAEQRLAKLSPQGG